MAEGIARRMLAEKLQCAPDELEGSGVRVKSAGIWASDGAPATPEAVSAAMELGADISKHRSSVLTSELIQDADVVFCLTEGHVEQATALSPWPAGSGGASTPGPRCPLSSAPRWARYWQIM